MNFAKKGVRRMEIRITKITPEKRKPIPTDESQLGFGKKFTDHFFNMKYHEDRGWYDPVVEPYRDISLDPTALCLHYGQLIFEGLKAYHGKGGEIYLFRPLENLKRMNASAERLCMPTVDPDLFLEAIKKLVILDKQWLPKGQGTSLYIRPTMIATEAALGVHEANAYLFFIVIGPVGAYYTEGFSPTKIYVSEDYVRSVKGGIGYCKAAGNYAASLYASKIAMKKGYTQVLWLDAVERKYVEEVGTSNIFFRIGDELITSPLTGSILPGVTRDSVIQMARSWGMQVSERPLSMDEILAALTKGTLREAFASGTAAIVSPVGQMFYKGTDHIINEGKIGSLTERLYNEILQIQYGEKEDPFGWRIRIH
jgi:branched-chain amino acid aminotransferase